ncbi:MAG: FG-GAP-like repeat-containing protein [Pyrinomonadaceae bacterium]
MKIFHAFPLFNHSKNSNLSPAAALFAVAVFLFSAADVSTQSKFSNDDIRPVKTRRMSPNMERYHSPKDEIQLSAGVAARGRSAADGNIDPSFNASVTESYGYVNKTIVQPDGKIIAVGSFGYSDGAPTYGVARFNADGTLDAGFNTGTGSSTYVRAVALQADGKILVGGWFTIFNGQAVKRIVRLNSDGSVDSSFSTVVNFASQIEDIAVQPDGKILVGGGFSISGSRLVRLNNDGTLETAFSGFTSTVYKIVYTSDGKILVGKSPGSPARGIARINNDGTADSTFNPGNGPSGTVYEIVVQPDGKIILGGLFDSFNGTPTDAIVRINDNGSLDTAFEFVTPSGLLYLENSALALQPDGKILASYYKEDDTGNVTRVARFNADATLDPTFTTGNAEGYIVADINLTGDGKALLGGAFISYNNQQHLRLLKLNSDGTTDNAFNPSVSSLGVVWDVKKQTDGKVLIAGDFAFVNGVRTNGIARLNTDGTLDNTFNSGAGFNGYVNEMAIQPDGKIVAVGIFISYDNNPAIYAARLNANGSLDLNLYPESANFLSITPYSVALQPDGKILIGGNIATSSPFGILPAIRLNAGGGLDNTFNAPRPQNAPNVLSLILQPNGKIVIGGLFFSTPSFPRTGVARLNSDGTLDSAPFAGSGNVYALTQRPDGTVYAGGSTVTRYNSEGVLDTTLNTGSGLDNVIRAIAAQPDGKIIIGGHFTTYNGTSVNRIARINVNGSLDTSFNTGSGTTGAVFALAIENDGKILVGGQFYAYNNTQKFSLFRLQNTAPIARAPFDFDGDGKTDISIFRPSNGEWWYRRSIDGGNYAAQFGNSADKLVPGDYTGDGKTDIAIFRPSTGEWFILRSEDGSYYSFPFGTSGDIPAVGDFDGDGKADQAVFRPSDTTWYIRRSSDGGFTIQQFGASNDVPAVADYDGDGKSDIAIWRVSVGEWWIQKSSNSSVVAFQFGNSADKPVQGDYTGDGKADVAIYRPSTGEWFILRSEDFSYYSFPFGASGDIPTPGDYDGDGKADAAVFRPSDTNWYLQRTTAGFTAILFGFPTDKPVPNAFVP